MGPELRRHVLRGVLAAAAIGGAGVVTASTMLPDVIRSRAQQVAKVRLGLPLSVGQVQLTASGAVLRDVHLGGAADDGLDVHVDRVRVSVDVWRLPFGARAAIRRLDVGEVALRVDAPSPSIHRALFGGVRRGSEPPRDRQARRWPPFTVERVGVRMSDGAGQLLEAELPEVRYAGSILSVDDAALSVGDPESGTIRLQGVAMAARRSDRWRLTAVDVASAQLQLPPATTPPLPGPGDPPDADPVADLEAGNPPDSDPVRPAGILARLRALAAVPVGAQGLRAPSPGPPDGASLSSPLARLGPGARLALQEGTIVGVSGGKPTDILRGLRLDLARGQDGRWRFEGSAKGEGGGRVKWAFAVEDEPLGANGRLDMEAMPLPLVAQLLPAIPWHRPERSHLDARLVLETRSVDQIGISGVVDLVGAAIASDRVAPMPVEDLDVRLSGRGSFLPLTRTLEIETGSVEVGGARVDITGTVSKPVGRYAMDVRATLEQTPCDDAIRSVPAGLLGDLVHARWDGSIAGSLHVRLDSEHLDDTLLEIDVDDRCGFVTVPAIVDLRRFRQPFVHTVLEPDGTVVELETGPGTVTWTYLEDVSPFLVHAVLSHEDSRFFTHGGFSPPHIRNALVKNLQQGRYAVGASTITMQLVKNVFLRREKTLARKTQEVLLTWWIERVMEKRDILELYLNVIEYGPGVYGIRNAAMHYFKRLPSDLSPAEAVYLSTILPNPKKYYGAYERGSISERWADRMRKIFGRLRARKRYSQEATRYGLDELANFRFVHDGEFTSAREVPGGTSALPYMADGGAWPDQAEEPQGEDSDVGDEDDIGDAWDDPGEGPVAPLQPPPSDGAPPM